VGPSPAEIDAKARALMQEGDVKGMALALIRDGRIVHVAAFGARNVEQGLPLDTDTVMYGASFTKTAVAYLVLHLVEAGLMDLDRPLAGYLDRPLPEYQDYAELAGDDRWQRVTARHVLTHSTGFANFRWLEHDQQLRFHFEPGSRYAYSGEGFYLLQLAIEEGLGLRLEAEIQARVFGPMGLERTSLQWRDDFASNLADGYRDDGSFEVHDSRSSPSAAGSMDTTIADQARLFAGIVRGDGLAAATRAQMSTPQRSITSAEQFPTLLESTDPRGPEIRLSAGLGVVTYQGDKGLAWFKGGHNDSTGNFVVCQEATRDCLVMMANSVRAERIYPELAAFVLGDTALPLWWEYGHVH
jgi:CubicO group peptidase (beta-lactamase class C family)